MRWRCGSENVSDLFFEVSIQREVHVPVEIRRPMPVYYVLIVLTVPVPLNSCPEFSDTINKVVPNGVGGLQILPKREQSLHEERGLHKITAIVFLTERDHLASASVY